MNTPTTPYNHISTRPVWLIHPQQHTHDGYLSCTPENILRHTTPHNYTYNTYKHWSTHLVNAFFLMHHPSAHRTEQPPCPSLHCSEARPRRPFHILQLRAGEWGWEGRREGRESSEGREGERQQREEGECGSRRGKSGKRRKWRRRREKHRREGRDRYSVEQSCSELPLLSRSVIFSSSKAFSLLACPLHLSFNERKVTNGDC